MTSKAILEDFRKRVRAGARTGAYFGLFGASMAAAAMAVDRGPSVQISDWGRVYWGWGGKAYRVLAGVSLTGAITGVFVAAYLPRLLRWNHAAMITVAAALIFTLLSIPIASLTFQTVGSTFVYAGLVLGGMTLMIHIVRHLTFYSATPSPPLLLTGAANRWTSWSPVFAPAIVLLNRRRDARRAKTASRAFPDEWAQILTDNVPMAACLSPEARTRLHGMIRVFIAEKLFEGCGGLEMTDEVRVTIAAQACLLEIAIEPAYYPNVRVILVYPTTYIPIAPDQSRHGVLHEETRARLGESWKRGVVVVAWDAARHGAADMKDGQNLIMHEFAHQLDTELGDADGTPYLEGRTSLPVWSRVMKEHLNAFRKHVDKGWTTPLDEYGATNEAEFFAVATETFFEKPHRLSSQYPELYRQLRKYYQQNPLDYHVAAGASEALTDRP